jgi:hypothetical protein
MNMTADALSLSVFLCFEWCWSGGCLLTLLWSGGVSDDRKAV